MDSSWTDLGPVLAFIDEVGTDEIINEPTAKVYNRYCEFCLENGCKEMSKLTFSKRINQVLGTVVKPMRFDNNLQKVFIEP